MQVRLRSACASPIGKAVPGRTIAVAMSAGRPGEDAGAVRRACGAGDPAGTPHGECRSE
jgi:hypothetical protein